MKKYSRCLNQFLIDLHNMNSGPNSLFPLQEDETDWACMMYDETRKAYKM